jgi:endoglucanase
VRRTAGWASRCLAVWVSAAGCGDSGSGGSGGTGGSLAEGVGGSLAGNTGVGAPAGGTVGTGGSAAGDTGGSVTPPAVVVSPYLVVDQFGYLPDSVKIAVVRDPQTGFDADESFTPGASYVLVDAASGTTVLTGAAVAWNSGGTDATSGDRAWWFDFSSVQTLGTYYVVDVDRKVRSHRFDVSDAVYRDVLRQAVRTFFYQRAGQSKQVPYAEAGWTDDASHLGALQDHNARLYNDRNNAATERDLWGGWYDAGDYNKYTSWTASYVVTLLRAYHLNPSIWTDDFSIPESGNGIPDVLDEAMWGLDYLVRLQNSDGSVLSIVGESHASPPSAATGPSLYGPENTSATLGTAAAFAYGSHVLGALGNASLTTFVSDLHRRAEDAWNWADANPNVVFRNNEGAAAGLGAGQQEVDDAGRTRKKLAAACYLYELTGAAAYRTYFDANYAAVGVIGSTWLSPWEGEDQELLLHYTLVPGATTSVVNHIRTQLRAGYQGGDWLGAYRANRDPYRAHLAGYTWGSNATKSQAGYLFQSVIAYGIDAAWNTEARAAAEGFLHYLHGTNPLSLVYLSNMNAHGAENSVREFFHSWFTNGSAVWDRVGTSTYGPAPGFLAGGPNPSYDWDGCCDTRTCGSTSNNAACDAVPISPPRGQPAQKAFLEFNDGWPLNSWAVTENSCGYQAAYIRLLSPFVR